MPLYEYLCSKCGRETEVLQKLSDPPLRRCPHCRGRVEKKLSRTSFQLRGGGWYAEGYSSSSGSGGSKSESGDKDKKSSEAKPSKSTSGGGTKSD